MGTSNGPGAMAVEIERRFLVAGHDWRPHIRWQALLRQGYLVANREGIVVRVRISQSQNPSGEDCSPVSPMAWLTLKAAPPGGEPGQESLSRLEFEYAIPELDAIEMLTLTNRQLSKVRYGLDLPDGDWVLDVFAGANSPLVLAEVELLRPDQPVSIPAWCVREVTGCHALSNAALAERPLNEWSPSERSALDL